MNKDRKEFVETRLRQLKEDMEFYGATYEDELRVINYKKELLEFN